MSEKFEPRCMRKWERAPNYLGEDLSDYYMVVSRSRDSGLLDVSNFESVKRDFADKEGIETASFGHWAVGWIETMMVRDDAPENVLEELDEVMCQLKEEYPVYDEDDYYQRERDATIDNIKFEGRLDDNTATEVLSWLSRNEPEEVDSHDDRGGYPSSEAIQRALEAIEMEV